VDCEQGQRRDNEERSQAADGDSTYLHGKLISIVRSTPEFVEAAAR
jgi:hypothetical protein